MNFDQLESGIFLDSNKPDVSKEMKQTGVYNMKTCTNETRTKLNYL